MDDKLNTKVKLAVRRLSDLLPIKKALDDLDAAKAALYFALQKEFYHQGRALLIDELKSMHPDVSDILTILAARDMLTLDHDGEINGFYPFTMEPRVHRLRLNGHQVHAMCALDALAPGAMFRCRVEIRSECAVSAMPIQIEIENRRIINSEDVADVFFGINWMAARSESSCSESLCTEMLFLKNTEIARHWVAENAHQREIFNLHDAIAFSSAFFIPVMAQG